MNNPNRKGSGLINPNQRPVARPQVKQIDIKQDGLMEREESQVLTKDGRELLKERK